VFLRGNPFYLKITKQKVSITVSQKKPDGYQRGGVGEDDFFNYDLLINPFMNKY